MLRAAAELIEEQPPGADIHVQHAHVVQHPGRRAVIAQLAEPLERCAIAQHLLRRGITIASGGTLNVATAAANPGDPAFVECPAPDSRIAYSDANLVSFLMSFGMKL